MTLGLVCLADLFSRTDLALSVFYTVPIALTLWLPPRRDAGVATYVALALALGATLLALFLGADAHHAPGPHSVLEDDPVALGNRLLGAISQLVVAWAVVRHRRTRAVEREMVAKLRLALRATDEFVAVASHELRTPLTGARGYAQLLLRRARGGQLPGLDAKGAAALALIDDLLGRLHALMDDMLHVSRLHSGRLDQQPEHVDVAAVARDVARALEPQAPQHTIVVLPETADVWAWADPRRVEQILANLMGNAVKYSPEGGRIEVAIAAAPRMGDPSPAPADAQSALSQEAGTSAVVVTVRDEGIGIPAADRGRLFERFMRASNALASPIGGTGLGLYLCRMLVEAQGGRIWLVDSDEGRGATFAFSLPAWAPSPSEPAHAPEGSAPARHPATPQPGRDPLWKPAAHGGRAR